MKLVTILPLVRTCLAGLGLGLALSAPAAEIPGPQVSVSLRGVAEQTLPQGEPWRVVVRLDLPRGSRNGFILAPSAGTWADAIAVELYPVAGSTPAARAVPVGKPDAVSATLDASRVAGGLWRFSSESMWSVSPGDYVLRVQLKISDGGDWQGVASAEEIPLMVVAPAGQPSGPMAMNRAQDLLLLDQIQAAAAEVDAELKNTPRDYALLRLRAVIAEKAGNPFAATLCLNAANISTPEKTTGQPPAEDIAMLARLEKSRKTAGAAPAWTWPPSEVLAALAQEPKKFPFFPPPPPERAAGGGGEGAPKAPVNSPSPASIPGEPKPEAAVVTTPVQSVPAGPPPGVIVPAAELNDKEIAADPAGQWASAAKAGSQYSSPGYAADRLVGPPDVPQAGDSGNAWCPGKSSGTEWCEVIFARPGPAVGVRVRQNNAPGAIVKVEALEPNGTVHLWWEGTDPVKAPAEAHVAWFAVRVPRTAYAVAKIRLTLNLGAVAGWKEIDAVQLAGAPN